MPYYVAPQCPEHLFFENSKNIRQARYKVAQRLATLINEGSLMIRMPHKFSTRQFVEITEEDLMSKEGERIAEAVKILSKLSISKQKAQELYKQSLQACEHIELLFEERLLDEDEFQHIKVSLKIIDSYANAVSAYKETLPEAHQAKDFLAQTLELPE
jgi:hypothetical protein